MTNTGLELPSFNELNVLDGLLTAHRTTMGTPYHGRVSEVLLEAFSDALLCPILASRAMDIVDRHGTFPARQICALVIRD